MTATEIEVACRRLPDIPGEGDRLLAVARDIPEYNIDGGQAKFVSRYKSLDFVWQAAKALAQNHIQFPSELYECEYLWKAYLFHCGVPEYRDITIDWALQIYAARKDDRRRSLLEGALLTFEPYPVIAKALGLNVDLVEAYAETFYDVRGRRHDVSALVETVYPHGRYVEYAGDYMQAESIAHQLKRAAYNGNIDEMLFFAGASNNVLLDMQKQNQSAQFDLIIMAQGMLMAKHNYIDSKSFQTAKSNLASSKIGGTDSGPQSPLSTLGHALMGEIKKAKRGEAIERANKNLRRQSSNT